MCCWLQGMVSLNNIHRVSLCFSAVFLSARSSLLFSLYLYTVQIKIKNNKFMLMEDSMANLYHYYVVYKGTIIEDRSVKLLVRKKKPYGKTGFLGIHGNIVW